MRASSDRLILSAFLGIFALVAGVASLVGWTRLASAPSERTWLRLDAQVISAGIEVNDKSTRPFSARVEYTYTLPSPPDGAVTGQSQTYRGRNVVEGGLDSADYTQLWLKLRPFTPGARVHAFVDPSNPARAVLRFENGGLIALQYGGGAMTVLLLGGMIGLWLSKSAGAVRWILRVSLMLAGLGLASALWKPLSTFAATRFMTPTPCTILYSQVRRSTQRVSQTSVRHTFRPDILFEYQVDGVTYRSNQIRPVWVSSWLQKDARAVVETHPPGHTVTCLVNARSPWISCLDKRLGGRWILQFYPLPILVAGGICLYFWQSGKTTRSRKVVAEHLTGAAEAPGDPQASDHSGPDSAHAGPPLTIKISRGRVEDSAGLLTGLLFMWIFVRHFMPDLLGDLMLKIGSPAKIITGAVVVGLVTLVGRSLLRLFNPWFTLDIPHGLPRRGEGMELHWRMTSGWIAPTPRNLKILVQAQRVEPAHERTVTFVLWEATVAEVEGKVRIARGQGICNLPRDVPGVTRWMLLVRADVPGWPDVADEEYLEVRG